MKATWVRIGLLFALMVVNDFAANDPIQDYLQQPPPYTRVAGKFYLDDRLLRLDLDLNNDGSPEILLSLARDRDGKNGNIWKVYEKSGESFKDVGEFVFSASGFYLGKIDEVEEYGLVSFFPSGGGEGTLFAHIFNGRITDIKLGEVVKDPQTKVLKGAALLSKYMGSNAIIGDDVITVIPIDELASKYGIKVEPKTYLQALQEGLPGSTPIKVTPETTSAPAVRIPSGASASSSKPSSPAISPASEPQQKALWVPLLSSLVMLVLAVLGVIWYWKKPSS